MKVSNFILSEHQPWNELLERVQGFLLPSNINPLGLGSQIKAVATLPLNTVYQAFVKGVGCSGIKSVKIQFQIGITTNWGSGYLIPFEGKPLVVKSVTIEDGNLSIYTRFQWVDKGLFVPVNKNLQQGTTVTATIYYYTAVNYEGAEKPVSLLLDREEFISIVPSIVTTVTGTVKVRVVGKGKIASIEASNGTWRTPSEKIPTWLIGSEVTEAGEVKLTTRYGKTATLHVNTAEESIKAVPVGDIIVPYGNPVKYQLIGTGVIDKVEWINGSEATYTLSSNRLPATLVISDIFEGSMTRCRITLKGGTSVEAEAYTNRLDRLMINSVAIVKDKLNIIPEYHPEEGSTELGLRVQATGTNAGYMSVKITCKGAAAPFINQIITPVGLIHKWIDTLQKELLCDVEISYDKTPVKYTAELRLPVNTYIPQGYKVEGAMPFSYDEFNVGSFYSQVFDDFEYKMHDSVVSVLCGISGIVDATLYPWLVDGYELVYGSQKDEAINVQRVPSFLWNRNTEPWIEAPIPHEYYKLCKSRQEYVQNTFGVKGFPGCPLADPLVMKGGPRFIQRMNGTIELAKRTSVASHMESNDFLDGHRFCRSMNAGEFINKPEQYYASTLRFAYKGLKLVYLIADDPEGLVNLDFDSHTSYMDKTLKMVAYYNDNSKKVEYVMPKVTGGSEVVTWIPKLNWRVVEIPLSEIPFNAVHPTSESLTDK